MRVPIEPKRLWKTLKPLGALNGDVIITPKQDHVVISMLDSSHIFYFQHILDRDHFIIGGEYEKALGEVRYEPGDPIAVNISSLLKTLQMVKNAGLAIFESIDNKLVVNAYTLYYPHYYYNIPPPQIETMKVEIQALRGEDNPVFESTNIVYEFLQKLKCTVERTVSLRFFEDVLRFGKDLESIGIEVYDNNIKVTIYNIASKPVYTMEYNENLGDGNGNKLVQAYYTLQFIKPAINVFKALREYEIDIAILDGGPLKLSNYNTTILIAPRIEP